MCLGVALSALCCAGKSFCSNLCKCCKECCGTTIKEQIKLAYILFILILMFLTIMISHYVQDMIEPWADYISCPAESGGKTTCLGVSAVYRMSFSLVVMFVFILLCLLCKNKFSESVNEGFWCLKLTFLLAFWILTLFIRNSFFEGYLEFAKYVSILYMIFQSIIFIDLFYLWGMNWVKKYDGGQECMKYVLILTFLIEYGLIVVFNIYNYNWFDGCSRNTTILSINIVLIALCTFVQVMGWNPHGSLITTGAQGLYMTYLTFSALISGSEQECNNVLKDKTALGFEIAVGFVFTIIVLFYLSLVKQENTSGRIQEVQKILQTEEQKKQDQEQEMQELKGEDQKQKDASSGAQQVNIIINEKESQVYESNTFLIFHVIMVITSIYLCALITNWGSPSIEEEEILDSYQPSSTSYWVKIIISWCSALLYIWTLIAPKLFPNRDFSK